MRGLNKHIKTSTEHTNKWLNQNLPTVPGLILWGKCEQRLTSYRAPKVKCFSHVPSSPLASLLPHAAGDYTPQTAMGSRAVSGNGRIWDPSQVLVLGIAARKAAAAKLGDAAPSSSQGGLGSCELPNSKVGTTQHPRGPASSLRGSKGWQGWTNNPIIVLQIIWGEKTNKQTNNNVTYSRALSHKMLVQNKAKSFQLPCLCQHSFLTRTVKGTANSLLQSLIRWYSMNRENVA